MGVTFAKLFMDYAENPPVSKGCGKVFYVEPEMAQRAIFELDEQMVGGKKITVEILGQESDRRKQKRIRREEEARKVAERAAIAPFTDDEPPDPAREHVHGLRQHENE